MRADNAIRVLVHTMRHAQRVGLKLPASSAGCSSSLVGV